MEETLAVVAPTGRQLVSQVVAAAPLQSLAGARVAEIWDWLFRGDELFALLRGELRRREPLLEVIEYPVVGRIHGPEEAQLLAGLPQVLARERAGAVISGVGA